jgi:hypothetical protein
MSLTLWLTAPEYDRREIACVNLVQLSDGEWNPDMADTGDDDEHVEDEEDIEGDENFVKVPLRYLGAESYKLYSPYTFQRYLTYRRDDGVSWGGGALNPHDF